MRTVSNNLLDELTQKAKKSSRRRAHFLFHKHSDPVHRLLNAIEPGAYISPHKHQNPDKVEAVIILRGKAAYLRFDDLGKITEIQIIKACGPVLAVDIPSGTWHSFISLSSGTVFFEVIQGPYLKATHKKFAPWAPKESEKTKAKTYLRKLRKVIKKEKAV